MSPAGGYNQMSETDAEAHETASSHSLKKSKVNWNTSSHSARIAKEEE